MHFALRSGRSAVLGLAGPCSIVAVGGDAAAATEYDIQTFDGGPAWFVYDEPVDVALHVLKPDDPKCHEIGEVILVFKNRDQLRDDALIEKTALTGMNCYAELCRSLGANPSNQRKVAGIIVGVGAPDAQGCVMGDARVLDAMASSLTGEYQLWVRHSDRRMVRQPGRMRERAGNPVRARRSRHGRMVARLERGHWPLTLANRPMRAP